MDTRPDREPRRRYGRVIERAALPSRRLYSPRSETRSCLMGLILALLLVFGAVACAGENDSSNEAATTHSMADSILREGGADRALADDIGLEACNHLRKDGTITDYLFEKVIESLNRQADDADMERVPAAIQAGVLIHCPEYYDAMMAEINAVNASL